LPEADDALYHRAPFSQIPLIESKVAALQAVRHYEDRESLHLRNVALEKWIRILKR
jgi:hypothetical protein